jgi:hypothetical protein
LPLFFEFLGLGFADLAGFLALIFITATAVMMFIKSRLFNRYQSHKNFIKNTHIVLAALGGCFLLIHGDFFLRAPILETGIFLGYLGTAVAVVVWFTGFSFLERLRYSLLYHGSLSLFAISLMVIHTVDLGFNISIGVTEVILIVLAVLTFYRAMFHASKILAGRKNRSLEAKA